MDICISVVMVILPICCCPGISVVQQKFSKQMVRKNLLYCLLFKFYGLLFPTNIGTCFTVIRSLMVKKVHARTSIQYTNQIKNFMIPVVLYYWIDVKLGVVIFHIFACRVSFLSHKGKLFAILSSNKQSIWNLMQPCNICF